MTEFRKTGDNTWTIRYGEKEAGTIAFAGTRLTFMIFPPFRHQHIGAEAIRDFTGYAHKELGMKVITARAERRNPDAWHILEHAGYAITEESEEMICYMHEERATVNGDAYEAPKGQKVIWFAGGCFWGTERIFQMLNGVTDTCVGYANGTVQNPVYERVLRGDTGYKECVRVTYDPRITALETLLEAFFLCIDPTVKNRQGNDIGTQYQTGIWWRDEETAETVRTFADREKQKYERFCTEYGPLQCFYEAEEYHQKYLDKHPYGYCHITRIELEKVKKLNQKPVAQ